jgi:hypothetical protein
VTVSNPKRPTYTLENLLSADILKTSAEILHALNNIRKLVLIPALNGGSLSDGEVEVESDTVGVGREPSGIRLVRGPETDTVLAGIGSSEGKATLVGTLLVHDTMVIVEGLVNGNQERELVVFAVGVGLGLPLLGLELS